MTKISFVGAGNMAQALIGGLLRAGHPASELHAADPVAAARDAVATLGVAATDDNAAAVADSEVVLLAVKPQVLAQVLAPLHDAIPEGALVMSIVAGMPLAAIEALLRPGQPVVRCMPNTPALLSAGITGMFANRAVSPDQRAQAETLAGAAGEWVWVDEERQLDAVTAVSGSGPAYFFYLMEAMIEAGVELGLDAELARRLTVSTAAGAAAMANQPDAVPGVLRQNVTSPGGTTEAALNHFEAQALARHIRAALTAADRRAAELAKEFS
ncbi:MAG: pyrroline-5-carboxylate reductase [Pseudomonadota bacterium]